MEKAVQELQETWREISFDLLSEHGILTQEEVHDCTADQCCGLSFCALSDKDQKKALLKALPGKRYGI